MRALSIICGLFLVLALTGCEDKQAADIKAETEAQLAALAESKKLTSGSVTVESEGDGYRVSIADVVMFPSADTRLPLGVVSYLHERVDDDTVRYADIEIASPVEVQSADGEPQGEISFEIEHGEGVWSEPLESFVALDFLVPSLRMVSSVDPTVAALTGLAIKTNTTDATAARTDQNGEMTIEAVEVTGDEADIVRFEGVTAQSRVLNVDLAAMAAASASFETATMTGENLAPAIVAMLNSFSTSDGTVTFDRVTHIDATGNEDFSLTNMRIVGTLADADKETGRLNFAIGYDSITLPPAVVAEDPMVELLAPQVLAFNVDFANVPFRQAANQLAAIAPSVKDMGADQPEIAGLVLMSALRAAFAEAGTTIRFDGTRIQMKDALVTVTGGVDVDPNVPLGIIGTVDVSLFGLDALMASAQALPASPEADEFRGTLEYLALMAERGEEGGETVDRYRVEATDSGAVLVNGQQMF